MGLYVPYLDGDMLSGGGGGGGSTSLVLETNVDVSNDIEIGASFSGATIHSAKLDRYGRLTIIRFEIDYTGTPVGTLFLTLKTGSSNYNKLKPYLISNNDDIHCNISFSRGYQYPVYCVISEYNKFRCIPTYDDFPALDCRIYVSATYINSFFD